MKNTKFQNDRSKIIKQAKSEITDLINITQMREQL